MAAFVAEHLNHQIGCAIHNLGPVGKSGRRINETAEADDPRYLVEIAERGFHLGQQIDGRGARGFLAVVDRN